MIKVAVRFSFPERIIDEWLALAIYLVRLPPKPHIGSRASHWEKATISRRGLGEGIGRKAVRSEPRQPPDHQARKSG